MSEEEKKALEYLREGLKSDNRRSAFYKIEADDMRIVLNLVEKLQKDLELDNEAEIALNNQIMNLSRENEELKATLRDTQNSWFEDTKKIEKLKKQNQCYINSMQSIVPVLTQDYIEKQKIKDKVEEIQEEYSKLDEQLDEYIKSAEKDVSTYYENKERISIMQTLSWVIDNLNELLEESEEKDGEGKKSTNTSRNTRA